MRRLCHVSKPISNRRFDSQFLRFCLRWDFFMFSFLRSPAVWLGFLHLCRFSPAGSLPSSSVPALGSLRGSLHPLDGSSSFGSPAGSPVYRFRLSVLCVALCTLWMALACSAPLLAPRFIGSGSRFSAWLSAPSGRVQLVRLPCWLPGASAPALGFLCGSVCLLNVPSLPGSPVHRSNTTQTAF